MVRTILSHTIRLTAALAVACSLVACNCGDCTPAAPKAAGTSTSTTPQAKSERNNQEMKQAPKADQPGTPDLLARTESEWRSVLTPEQYRVLREKGTERAFTGKYFDTKTKGVYKCAACGEVLFTSDAKFDSHCGWPSFFTPLAKGKIVEHVDSSAGMTRIEVTCAKCGGHLGHVFEDAPDQPTGLRYCINSVSIELVPADETEKKDAPDKK